VADFAGILDPFLALDDAGMFSNLPEFKLSPST
jgi:hypothetical protein